VTDDIGARLAEVRARIERARVDAGIDAVTLVAVSKHHPATAVLAALEAGATDFGENYAQELEAKRAALDSLGVGADPRLRWHMIGPVQSNKVKRVIGCALVYSVDRPSLVAALDRRAAAAAVVQSVLVQVNVDDEVGKAGVAPAALGGLLDAIAACDALRCRGLMLIPRPGSADALRGQFAALRRLRDLHAFVTRSGVELAELSMGMSDDFELAIAEGATIVRVGTAIFGERPY